MTRSAARRLEVVETPAEQPAPVATPDAPPRRKDGIVIRTVSGSIRLIGSTSVFVGGNALGSLGRLGLPRPVANTLVGGQARTMRVVTSGTDKVTTATLRGIGKGGRVLAGGTTGALGGAARGAVSGARTAWNR
jgi:hypothetical protein